MTDAPGAMFAPVTEETINNNNNNNNNNKWKENC